MKKKKKKVGSAVADSTVINQASTMFKPLNTDLPQSAWVWGGLNKSASAMYMCTITASGRRHVVSYQTTIELGSEWVESWVHAWVLGADS